MAIEMTDSPIDSRISLNKSIPGQGLTNDPDNPYPWEKSPEFVELDESLRLRFFNRYDGRWNSFNGNNSSSFISRIYRR